MNSLIHIVIGSVLQENPFDYIKDNTFSDDERFYPYMASAVHAIVNIGIALIAISIVVLFIRWGITRKEDKKNKLVAPLVWKLVALVILSGFIFFATLLYNIIDSIAAQMVI